MNYLIIFTFSFFLAFLFGKPVIAYCKKLKIGQSIRQEGPVSHMGKEGTPTMGGFIFLIPFILFLSYLGFQKSEVWIILIVTLLFMLLGFYDDYLIIRKKQNKGLSAWRKLFLQLSISALLMGFLWFSANETSTMLFIPGTTIAFSLGWFYPIFLGLVVVGTTNAVNLTDGLDGLASSVSIIALLSYSLILTYFNLPFYSMACFGLAAALLGFLIYNRYPAKIFMGNTGSLAIGGALSAVAVLSKTELLLLFIGGVFVLEALSVILQVSYFKLTKGKRIFKMSPLHHHFELSGWSEPQVVWLFSSFQLIFSLLAIVILFYLEYLS